MLVQCSPEKPPRCYAGFNPREATAGLTLVLFFDIIAGFMCSKFEKFFVGFSCLFVYLVNDALFVPKIILMRTIVLGFLIIRVFE